MMLQVQDLTVRYGALTIVDRVSFTLEPQQWLMLVGPNGAGKSTIVSALSQGTKYTGAAYLDGQDMAKCTPAWLAKRMGVLSQNHSVGYAFTVEEIVRMGRYAWKTGLLQAQNDTDEEKVEQALAMTGLEKLRGQSVLTLSGGELQRTFLAQIFAQDPKLLVLDEPTNHLDLVFQKQIFALIREWLGQPGRAVLSVVHDLSLARAYGTHALLLHGGKTVAFGPCDEVMTDMHLNAVYDMDVRRWMHELSQMWQ